MIYSNHDNNCDMKVGGGGGIRMTQQAETMEEVKQQGHEGVK